MHDSGVVVRGHSDFNRKSADTTSRFNTLPVESGSGNAHSGDDIGLQVQIVQGPGAEGRPPDAPRLHVAGRHQEDRHPNHAQRGWRVLRRRAGRDMPPGHPGHVAVAQCGVRTRTGWGKRRCN